MTQAHRSRTTGITCSSCGKGHLAQKIVSHDVGPLLGMPRVMVEHLPALACSKCGAVRVPGAILDAVSMALATLILRQPSLAASEIRFLRKLIGDTQEDFAKRLEVDRATVNRWENSVVVISGTPAYAIRSLVFFRLRDRSPAVETVAEAFIQAGAAEKRNKRPVYRIDAADLVAA